MRSSLKNLAEVLSGCGETQLAATVHDIVAGSDLEFQAFLTSNDLWGGAGSIADQAGIGMSGERTECRRKIESVLIENRQ